MASSPSAKSSAAAVTVPTPSTQSAATLHRSPAICICTSLASMSAAQSSSRWQSSSNAALAAELSCLPPALTSSMVQSFRS